MKDDKIKKCLIAGYDMDIISQEELNEYWNYITNLQRERNNFKTSLDEGSEIVGELEDRINKKDYLLIEQGKELKELYTENENLNQKIDKAINYIKEEYDNDLFDDTLTNFEDTLLNILKGEDK